MNPPASHEHVARGGTGGLLDIQQMDAPYYQFWRRERGGGAHPREDKELIVITPYYDYNIENEPT